MTALPAMAPEVVRMHEDLPIFRLVDGEGTVLYTPGNSMRVTRVLASAVEEALATGTETHDGEVDYLARTLRERARTARDDWTALGEKPFEPECLTLYLSNRCNLGCSYCYAVPVDPLQARLRVRLRLTSDDDETRAFPLLRLEAIEAAARLVAANCARQRKPLTLVIHGGGEPTLHWDLLQRVRDNIARVAGDHHISDWAYIATHGVMPESHARWLAERFNLIGLSCDGPPDVQDSQRKTAGGGPTSEAVERTALVWAAVGARYVIRATVTRQTVTRQSEILEYACDRLWAKTVRFEPAYRARHASREGFQPEDAEEFARHFLTACESARRRGCDLQVSGVRIDEIHGPYCNPLREVLQLTPDGSATACFLTAGNREPEDGPLAVGRFNAESDEFEIDGIRAAALRRAAVRVPPRCEECVNVYHCARDCPDICVIVAKPAEEVREGFRCRVQKILGQHRVMETATQS